MTKAKTQKEWRKLIDALPPLPMGQYIVTLNKEHADLLCDCINRISLALERQREPHGYGCHIGWDRYSNRMGKCTCGKDADLQRLLEGK